jgi:hypothetical protein
MGNAAFGDPSHRMRRVLAETEVTPAYFLDYVQRTRDTFNVLDLSLKKHDLTREEAVALLTKMLNPSLSKTRHEGADEMSKFKVTKDAAVKLMVGLGFKKAGNYNQTRLQEKLAKMDEIADGSEEEKLKGDKASFKLLKAIKAAITKGDEVRVVGGESEEPAKAESNGEGKPSKKAAAEKTKPEKEKGTKPRKVGVCATIRECLEKASKKSPATKEDILKVLVKRFGPGTEADKPEAGMKSTVAGFPSWAPSYFKVELGKDDEGGYWIKGEKAAAK